MLKFAFIFAMVWVIAYGILLLTPYLSRKDWYIVFKYSAIGLAAATITVVGLSLTNLITL